MFAASLANADEITVLGPEVLSAPLKEIAAAYDAGENKVRLAFDPADAPSRQLDAGAAADVLISADAARMDAMEKKELLIPGTRRNALVNTLVIVITGGDQASGPTAPAGLAEPAVKRIALADAKTPSGADARAFLRGLGLWEKVEAKVLTVADPAAVIAAIEGGKAEAGLVYKSDAQPAKGVRISAEIPPPEAPAIAYAFAVVKASRLPEQANRFATFLASPPAMEIFHKHGLTRVHGGAEPQVPVK